MYLVTPAQLMVNLYHFFSAYELSPLQLFLYGLKSASFWLSKTPLLASFGSDGGTGDFLKKISEITPVGVSFVS